MTEFDTDEQLEAMWQVSNVKGYPCPLFGRHSRAMIFPNKDIWMYHMTAEHKAEEYIPFVDVKQSFNEYVELYNQAMAQVEDMEKEETEVKDNDENNNITDN